MADSGNSGRESRAHSLPDQIGQMYYRHGLRCSSRPYLLLFLSFLAMTICCYPLISMPLLGSSSHHFTPDNSSSAPAWFSGPPVAFIQQIIVRAAVDPWSTTELQILDAFRSPLHETFRISELVSNHEYTKEENGSRVRVSLHDLCLQVQESLSKDGLLPQYSCLVVSPALIWQKDPARFRGDANLLETVLSQGGSSGPNTLKEILFGVPWRETGLKRSCTRNRQRILTYAITLLLDKYDLNFVDTLKDKLWESYPLHTSNNTHDSSMHHLHFRYVHHVAEFLPLICVYLVMLLYVYFSLSKMPLVRSKMQLALATVATVFLSMLMAVGICLWLRLNPTINGNPLVSPRTEPCLPSEILPYLLVIIGLENSLCITNSVMSRGRPVGAKVRLAQGLSQEGWSIAKNLLTELSLLTVAFFTFVPVIQEFCLFALIGVLCDFFLQHVFFVTLLSLDLQRKERMDSVTGTAQSEISIGSPLVAYPLHSQQMSRVFAGPASEASMLDRVPRRIRLLYIWARLRFVQRTLMAGMIVWIVLLVQHSGLIERLRTPQNATWAAAPGSGLPVQSLRSLPTTPGHPGFTSDSKKSFVTPPEVNTDDISNRAASSSLVHRKYLLWKDLPTNHWTTLFGYYNMSLSGRYVTLLPSIHLSVPITPERAISLRHPADAEFAFYPDWNLLQLNDYEPKDELDASSVLAEPLFLVLTIPTTLFIVYLIMVLYRCVCSRNYAQWRSSWQQGKGGLSLMESMIPTKPNYQIMETFPIRLTGHKLPVEIVVCHDNNVISATLGGDIRVWNATTGECLSCIDRPRTEVVTENRSHGEKRQIHNQHRQTSLRQSGSYSTEQSHDRRIYSPPKAMPRTRSFEALNRPQVAQTIEEGLIIDPVWSMACYSDWLLLGCASGRLEVWHCTSSRLCGSEHIASEGIVALHISKQHVIAATVEGGVVSLQLEARYSNAGEPTQMVLNRVAYVRAHTLPVTVISCPDGGPVVTGSMDRLVKVFRADKLNCIYTLHGHAGSISAIDSNSQHAVSGCQQGMLCLWDLLTGTCIYSLTAHKAAVSSIRTTALYVLSLAQLEGRMRVWEKTQGHLLHSLHVGGASPLLELLSDDIAVTARDDQLLLWDIHRGEPLQVVALGEAKAGVRTLSKASANTLVCDYANDLCVVYFPALTSKSD